MTVEPFKLSDSELSELLAECQRETEGRTRTACVDAATEIKGHEFAKRAITVAAAGQHSMCFIGGPQTGKTLLRALALRLGVQETFEVQPCPCGWLGSTLRACQCSVAKINNYRKRTNIEADLYVEVLPVPAAEMLSKSLGLKCTDIECRVEAARKRAQPTNLTPEALALMRIAQQELAICTGDVTRVLAVAGSIAKMDGCAEIQPMHITEAVGYRRLNGWN